MRFTIYAALCLMAVLLQSATAEKLTMRNCAQSTVAYGGVCDRAIDGNTNQNYNAGSCTHTNYEGGWWKAHTEQRALITEVRIYNRLDCCSDRLTNFVITVDGRECATYNSRSPFSVQTFQCDHIGQTVMIQNKQATALTLCEVEVFGTIIPWAPSTL